MMDVIIHQLITEQAEADFIIVKLIYHDQQIL